MQTDRHERLSRLFLQAARLPENERDAFLERVCAGDPGLLAEVRSLLEMQDAVTEQGATARLAAPVRRAMDSRDETSPASESEEYPPPVIEGFTVLRRIGSGGAGDVFEAEDVRMARRVALKVLRRGVWPGSKEQSRFEREAWIAGKLVHPNIVRVYERGESGGVPFYSMELVDGGSMDDVIANLRETGREPRFDLEFGTRGHAEWAIQQVAAAARALEHAHKLGVVHRDVKPMNLLVALDPMQVKLTDFGIAVDSQLTRLTTEGKIFGTVRYMAPEQLTGKTDGTDPRLDVYALGVTLFELLTLGFPHQGDTYEQYVSNVLTRNARRLGPVGRWASHDLEVVVGKALEREAKDRYATAGELADDLENVLGYRPIRARPPTVLERLRKWVRRRPVHAGLVGVLLLAVPTVGVLSFQTVKQQRLIRQAEVGGLIDRINSLGGEGRDREILDLSSRVLAIDPANPSGLRAQAVALLNLSIRTPDPAESEAFRDAAQAAIDRWASFHPESAGPLWLRAYLLRREGRMAEAEELERRAGVMEGNEEDALFFRGKNALELGDPALAEGLFSEVLRLQPRFDARQGRAAALRNLGRQEEALVEYQVLETLSPKDATVPRDRGLVLMLMGSYAEAEAALLRSADLNEDDPIVYERLSDNGIRWARALLRDGQREQAVARFGEASERARAGLAIRPTPYLHVNLGVSLAEEQRLNAEPDETILNEASRHYDDAARLAREAADARSAEALGTALVNGCDVVIQLGDFERALSVCRRVTEMFPEDPMGYYNLAGVYALTGRSEDALAALEKDLDLGDVDHKYLRDDDWFESLRDDPRFRDILRRMEERAASGS